MKKISYVALRVAISLLLLAGSWIGFVWLVDYPPVKAVPALVMVWTSVLFLFLAFFPGIISKIKRIKFKDYEIELQGTLSGATTKDYITVSELDDYAFSEKRGFEDLVDILRRVFYSPEKPVLLAVNLKNGNNISKTMLFIYLFFLDVASISVTVLIYSTTMPVGALSNIKINSIIGVISGKAFINELYKRYPHFLGMFRGIENRNNTTSFEDIFKPRINKEFFDQLHENIMGTAGSDFIGKEEVQEWLGDRINLRKISDSLMASELQSIREAFLKEEEYILLYKGKKLKSVVSLTQLSKNISKKLLTEILKDITK